jgi:hypothetical protein
LRSSFSIQTDALKVLAFWIKNVAGLACNPMLLVMVISLFTII